VRTVFADSLFWLGIIVKRDEYHSSAVKAVAALGQVRLLTTHEVLTEVIAGLSRYGAPIRAAGIAHVVAILQDPGVLVVEQSGASFREGLSRLARRLDKAYSLTDCISMNTMDQFAIREVLTYDRHFVQEHFVALMRSSR
jgi:predicted nucleic acid-binding protein